LSKGTIQTGILPKVFFWILVANSLFEVMSVSQYADIHF